ncbi:uncharacterized protein LOC144745001 [Ciona intestinalis]
MGTNENCTIEIDADYFSRKIWLAELLCEGFLFVMSAYLLIATLAYQYRRVRSDTDEPTEVPDNQQISNQQHFSRYSACDSQQDIRNVQQTSGAKNVQKKAKGKTKNQMRFWSEIMTVVAVLASFLSAVFVLLQLYFGSLSEVFCRAGFFVYLLLYNISMDSLYAILWLRQRGFYTSGPMKGMYSSRLRWFSKFIFFFVLITTAASTLMFNLTVTYTSASLGCMICKKYLPQWIGLIVVLANRVLMQSLLLSLVLYPLLKALKVRKVFTQNDARLESLIVRLATSTGFCVFFDIAFILGAVLSMEFTGSETITEILYSASMIVCNICVLASFPDWRKRLLVCSGETVA